MKTFKDTYDDEITVENSIGYYPDNRVYITFKAGTKVVGMALKPKGAKRLAKAIREAAEAANA